MSSSPECDQGPLLSRTVDVTAHWRRNLFAVTAATFIGFTGFTLVMPFLPLYFQQLGVTDVGEIALWTGISLGVTPAHHRAAVRRSGAGLRDRFGRKIMVERSLVSFVVIMALDGVRDRRPWHVFALRALQGLFAGYGALALAMAAESAPRDRMASAIGTVQTAQRLGPALGPSSAASLAQLVGLRSAFLVTSAFYGSRSCWCSSCTTSAAHRASATARDGGRRHVSQRAGVREFRAADGGDLRAAVRRPELRPGPAAVCRASWASPPTACRCRRRRCSRSPPRRRGRPSLVRPAAAARIGAHGDRAGRRPLAAVGTLSVRRGRAAPWLLRGRHADLRSGDRRRR